MFATLRFCVYLFSSGSLFTGLLNFALRVVWICVCYLNCLFAFGLGVNFRIVHLIGLVLWLLRLSVVCRCLPVVV